MPEIPGQDLEHGRNQCGITWFCCVPLSRCSRYCSLQLLHFLYFSAAISRYLKFFIWCNPPLLVIICCFCWVRTVSHEWPPKRSLFNYFQVTHLIWGGWGEQPWPGPFNHSKQIHLAQGGWGSAITLQERDQCSVF
jgi:hypothetical protein